MITSDSFYVPWGLIYNHSSTLPALESDFSQDLDRGFGGFWGLRHIIQHRPKCTSFHAGRLEAVDGKLPMAAYIDDEIFRDCKLLQLQDDWKHLSANLRLVVRRKRCEFEKKRPSARIRSRIACPTSSATGLARIRIRGPAPKSRKS